MIQFHSLKAALLSCLFFSCITFSTDSLSSKLESMFMPGPVIEGHKKYENDCKQCHSNFSKEKQSSLCLDCHEDIQKDITSNKGYHGKDRLASKQQCKQCHTDHKGRDANVVQLNPLTFNHKHTDFALKGKHTLLACQSCHEADKKHREAPSNCYSCHRDDDIHKGKLGKKCQSCHSEQSWKKSSFDHDDTRFSLKGKHQQASCLSCHPDNRHKDTPRTCYACHALDDAHQSRYGKKCQTCHTPEKWNKTHFNHNKKTKFPLKGKHTDVQCDACHTGNKNIYKHKPSKTCYACHKSDDTHKGKNGKKCQSCHTPKSWSSHRFSHNKNTDFPLRGKHAKLACSSCHMGSLKKDKLKKTCISCHKVDDVHNQQLSSNCQQCHNEKGWNKQIRFNHDITRFPLVGQHAITACEECHESHQYKDASTQCVSCHSQDDHHKKSLGPHCHSCHNPNDWKLWLFDHDRQTQFKLDGAHQGLRCINCHQEPTDDKASRSSTCATCHFKDDKHRGGFGRNCEQCHNTKQFSDLNM